MVLLRGLVLAMGGFQFPDAGIGEAGCRRDFLLDDFSEHGAQLVADARWEGADDVAEGGRGRAGGADRDRRGGREGGGRPGVQRGGKSERTAEDVRHIDPMKFCV